MFFFHELPMHKAGPNYIAFDSICGTGLPGTRYVYNFLFYKDVQIKLRKSVTKLS